MTRVRTLPRIPWLVLVLVAAIRGQETPLPDLEGGHFTVDGREFDLSREEMVRHFRFIRGRNPGISDDRAYELAWSRAIRTAAAAAAAPTIDEARFEAWMTRQHAEWRLQWLDESGEVDPRRVAAFVAGFGCKDLAEYEAACLEEYRAELWIGLLDTASFTEEAVRARAESLQQTLEIRALVFAEENFSKPATLDRDRPEHMKVFESWWRSRSDDQKKTYDDQDRPALEAEVIYVRFDDPAAPGFSTRFETPIPGLGRSLAELTSGQSVTEEDRARLFRRWSEKRNNAHAWLDRTVPAGTNDVDSFRLVEGELLKELRVIKYLGEVWQKLQRGDEPMDFPEVARRYGLSYQHVPLTPTRLLIGDEVTGLAGDQALSLRKIAPGSLYHYITRPEKPGSIYFVDGVVDQPGRHASIWKLVAAEELRVRPAEEIAERAWPDFQQDFAWKVAEKSARDFADQLDRQAEAFNANRSAEERRLPEEEPARSATTKRLRDEAVRATFNSVLDRAVDGRLMGPFFLQPYRPDPVTPRRDGPLGARVANLLRTRWAEIGGPPGSRFSPGQVLDLVFDPARRLAIVTRVDRVILPTPERLERDREVLAEARRSLEDEVQRARGDAIRSRWSWPNIVIEFKMKAPHFERVMAEKRIGVAPK